MNAHGLAGPGSRSFSASTHAPGASAKLLEDLLEPLFAAHASESYPELAARREGNYGGKKLAFLGIDDLVRSKETEREDDWRDVRLLEEIVDERRLAGSSPRSASDALARLRSQRGFGRAVQRGLVEDRNPTAEAYRAANNELSLAPPGGRLP